jgi:nitroimidazol reductase NimA-like FMN-containing flavoprotein (pyridoxamine 5'-phosphate oxidase superfamily)
MGTELTTPKSSRPYMPGYGILHATGGRGLLPWDWAVERLTKSRNYWVATTCADGRPHCVPVWGVWLGDAFYFSSGAKSRKARNLAANPNCVVCPEDGIQAVSLEGSAEKITDAETIRLFVEAYNPKYEWDLKVETVLDMGPILAVRPRKVIGVDATPGEFQGSATRWQFGPN